MYYNMKKIVSLMPRILCVFVGCVGMLGCNLPTDSDHHEIVRTGTTNQGRTFYVIIETVSEGVDMVNVHIEGEEETILVGTNLGSDTIDSIEVNEYHGDPNLIHITWQWSFYHSVWYEYFYYLVVPEGNTMQVLLKGQRTSKWSNWSYQRLWGYTHVVEYTDQIITIRERYLFGTAGSVCQVTETALSRSYHVNEDSVTRMMLKNVFEVLKAHSQTILAHAYQVLRRKFWQ